MKTILTLMAILKLLAFAALCSAGVVGCGSVENGYEYRLVIDDGSAIRLVGPPMGSHDNGLGGLPGQYSNEKYYFLDKWGDMTSEMKSHCRLYKRKSSADDWEETR